MNPINKLIVLYGEPNAGKTTTLKKVIEYFTERPIPSAYNEIRVVLKVGDATVYLATLGDFPGIIDTNFNFFHGTIRTNANVYELDGWDLKAIDKERLLELKPDICVTACRVYTDGSTNDAYQRTCEHILEDVPSSVKWILKEGATGNRTQQRAVNTDRLTALEIVAEIMNSVK